MSTLTEAVDLFTVAQAGEVSAATRGWYARRLASFVEFAGGATPVESVTTATLRAYRGHLVERELSPHTVHGHQRCLRRFFSWCFEERLVERNVARDVPLIRIPAQPPKALSDDDLRRLLERLPLETPRDRAIVLLLADTGCRVGGLCSLTLDTLDLANRSAMVIEKGRKARRIYYTTPTADAIQLWLLARPAFETRALFVTQDGNPLTDNGVRLMLQRLGRRAGVRGRCNAHSFRHAFARTFLRNGGNMAALGRILGHSPGSTVTARYYAVWDDRELQEFHDRYSPIACVSAG